MKIRSLIVAIFAIYGIASANAAEPQTAEFDAFTLTYVVNPDFGGLSFSFGSSGNVVGFGWMVPDTVQYSGTGSSSFSLPSFSITAKSGYSLSGFDTYLGNLAYFAVPGTMPSAEIISTVTLDGIIGSEKNALLTVASSGFLTVAEETFEIGSFGGTVAVASGGYSSLDFTGSLKLTPNGSAGIYAIKGNELKFSLVATSVPEPETYGMLLAGLGLIGGIARRKKMRS